MILIFDYDRSVHLCEPCCRREHELVTIKHFDKEFNVQEAPFEEQIASMGALKSSRKKHKKLKKEAEDQKKIAPETNPYKELELIKYHSVGSQRIYAARSHFVNFIHSLYILYLFILLTHVYIQLF